MKKLRAKYCVIPDIHGYYKPLKYVLDRIKEKYPDISYIFIGDLIDRGPNSYKVMKEVKKIVDSDHKNVLLRGNHEDMMINSIFNNIKSGLWLMNGGDATFIDLAKNLGIGEFSKSDLINEISYDQKNKYILTKLFYKIREQLKENDLLKWVKDNSLFKFETDKLFFSHAPQSIKNNLYRGSSLGRKKLIWDRIKYDTDAIIPNGKKSAFHGHQHAIKYGINKIRRVRKDKGKFVNLIDCGVFLEAGIFRVPIINDNGEFIDIINENDESFNNSYKIVENNNSFTSLFNTLNFVK